MVQWKFLKYLKQIILSTGYAFYIANALTIYEKRYEIKMPKSLSKHITEIEGCLYACLQVCVFLRDFKKIV